MNFKTLELKSCSSPFKTLYTCIHFLQCKRFFYCILMFHEKVMKSCQYD